MWKVEIEDKHYNSLLFEFKSLIESGDFIACAIAHSNGLNVTVVMESEGGQDEHK